MYYIKEGSFIGKKGWTVNSIATAFKSSNLLSPRISNLIGKGLPCHGSRCRFDSDLIRIRKSFHRQGKIFAKYYVLYI